MKSEKPKFIHKQVSGNRTYEIYKCTDAESAKIFLENKKVHKKLYYIIVETPEGNWGKDIEGLFLEHLLLWQKDSKLSHVVGSASPHETFGLQMAARGINDNFLCNISCGNCKHTWIDGLRYQNWTIVKCPNCGKYNKVDTSNIRALFIK